MYVYGDRAFLLVEYEFFECLLVREVTKHHITVVVSEFLERIVPATHESIASYPPAALQERCIELLHLLATEPRLLGDALSLPRTNLPEKATIAYYVVTISDDRQVFEPERRSVRFHVGVIIKPHPMGGRNRKALEEHRPHDGIFESWEVEHLVPIDRHW